MPRSLTAVLACILLLPLMLAAGFEVRAQVIMQDSFEDPYDVVTVYNDVTVAPNDTVSQPTSSGPVQLQDESGNGSVVEISEVVYPSGARGLIIEVTDGEVTVTLPPESRSTARRRSSLFPRAAPHPAISYPWAEADVTRDLVSGGWIIETGVGKEYSYDIKLIRIPETDSDSIPLTGIGEGYFIEAKQRQKVVELHGDCPSGESVCVSGRTPVLFIHGFQPEKGIDFPCLSECEPDVSDNGGEDYWGFFPQRLLNLQQDRGEALALFEFRWLTNARFRDVARDLADVINLIYTRTGGRKVHLVAHSMGGVLARTLVQGIDINEDAARGRIASLTTIGAPFLGVASERITVNGITFPQGQDRDGVQTLTQLCQQLSCHLLGERIIDNAAIAHLLGVQFEPGGLLSKLVTISSYPPAAVPIQTLIGFSVELYTVGTDGERYFSRVSQGDLLITGWSQRFFPTLSVGPQGHIWEPLWQNRTLGEATITEVLLGRFDATDPDFDFDYTDIGPEQDLDNVAQDDLHFEAFKHSPSTPAGTRSFFDYFEVCVGCDGDSWNFDNRFHDTVQRVSDWITPPPPSPPPSVGSSALNDTGIDWCADATTNYLDCPVAGYPGQDAESGRDELARTGTLNKVGAGAAGFDFTKLDANGNALQAST